MAGATDETVPAVSSGTEDTVAAVSSGTEDTVPASDLAGAEPTAAPAADQRYKLGVELGRGGMGRVVEAYDTHLGRTVALKEVLPSGSASHAKRFAREVKILAVGAVLFGGDVIGVNAEPIGDGEHITGAARAFRCINCGAASVLNDDHSWRCRVKGCYAGNAHVGEMEQGELAGLWAQAGNRVQWRPGT